MLLFLRREVHYRVNVKPHNENYTLEFMQKREWKYIEEMSNGSLDDVVTTLNSVLIVKINSLIFIFSVNNYRRLFLSFCVCVLCVCYFRVQPLQFALKTNSLNQASTSLSTRWEVNCSLNSQ